MLERMLREFSYKHDWKDEYYTDKNINFYFIKYRKDTNNFAISWDTSATCGQPNFISAEIARLAVEEVIRPFLKKHPDFVWGM